MTQLDHLIIPVSDQPASVVFYRDVLGFGHEGRSGPFEILRVNTSLTLDLMHETRPPPMHLAFSVDTAVFQTVLSRLQSTNIRIGSDVFERDGKVGENPYGARGLAEAFYFFDLDGHNLEFRLYGERQAAPPPEGEHQG